ncbi:MAG: hypothetical protein JXA73_18370 [Acidobacteria bacterium]|nr:hypothetical protein [Acidobacteriota bacterium]
MVLHFLFHNESGAALLLALLLQSLLTLLGLFISIQATTGVQISDNYESHIQATYAALAGLNHARILLCGLALNDVLRGPDGRYEATAVYMAEARSHRFRSPLPLMKAQTLNIADPLVDVGMIPDDGVFSTGLCEDVPGIPLIPITGISQAGPDSYGSGSIITSRYFVKAADNNGEASEIAGDAGDNPFTDGDGIIIVRSLGVAGTIPAETGSFMRRNSAAVFEARFKRLSTWALGSALVVVGSPARADFNGAFEISGGSRSGIATIDPVPGDTLFPDQIIRTAASGNGDISGGGEANPSVRDVTDQVRLNPDQRLLLNPAYLKNFTINQSPRLADGFYDGNQNWGGGTAPFLGVFDPEKPLNAPEQDPKITVVKGDLEVNGGITGGGLLIVTGRFSCSGSFYYSGLILLIGAGDLTTSGSCEIDGGIYIASLAEAGELVSFGTPTISISGNSRMASNRNAVQMAVGLIPPTQTGFREIAGADP